MRAKRAKQYKKAMNIYKTAFDFREPYQILRNYIIDSDFILECLKNKIHVTEQLSKTIGQIKVCKLPPPPTPLHQFHIKL
ncbi:rRNA-processing protein utp23 [Smittium culicis]|uniref:rRNA-processing protein utp23 n=1 Tax=Smittium culicis TaxID=133412 RepID=A0A1R1Y7Z6_9FUNG|nr:rRNA-processing protein utp23 [Smittium culicis]